MIINDKDRYGIVIDAGSSGSRLHIYRWKEPSAVDISNRSLAQSVPEIYQSDDWQYKVNPGLSSFKDKPDKAFSNHIKPLLDFAETIIPKEKIKTTPVFIQATAGMRLLKNKQQLEILNNVCKGIRKSTNFLLEDCSSQIQVIDGETEGIYGWLSLNYLSGHFNNFDPAKTEHFTFGFMDMGGASAQIAFVPSDKKEIERHHEDIATVKLKSINGDLQEWNVFVSTWLGFGANQARQRYLAQMVNALPENTNDYDDDDFSTRTLYDPCMPKKCEYKFEFKDVDFRAIGLGDYEQCSKSIYPLLLKNMPCEDEPCLFNGVHTPRIDFSQDKFVGISEYWYIPNDIFKLGGRYDFVKFSENVKEFCNSEWDTLLKNNEKGMYNSIPDKFLANSCFKSAWILNILHEGFEMPKDDSGKADDDPTFQSLDKVNNVDLSWTLGRILLFATGNINRGNIDEVVGITPSEMENKKFGKIFIPGALNPNRSENSSSKDPAIIGFLFKLVFVLVIAGFLFQLFLRKKSIGIRQLHFFKFHPILNPLVVKINKLRRGRSASYDEASELEEGRYGRSMNPKVRGRNDDSSFKLRSQSMYNLGNSSNDNKTNSSYKNGSGNNSKDRIKRPSTERSISSSARGMRPAFSLSDFSTLQDSKI